jgi:uncharacterized protein (TIGR03437 family)
LEEDNMKIVLLAIMLPVFLVLTGCIYNDTTTYCMSINGSPDGSAMSMAMGCQGSTTPPPSCTYPNYCPGMSAAPLMFERRQEQFLARTDNLDVMLAPDRATLANGAVRLALRLENAQPPRTAEGLDPQAGSVNYFIGNRPSQWRRDVHAYRRVRFREVYPGIDIEYYGTSRQLENDFILKPGADPESIRLAVEGATDVRVDPTGSLIINTGAGFLTWSRPRVYQNRVGLMVPVNAEYIVLDRNHVGFRVGDYDPEAELTIDPILTYSTLLGHAGNDSGKQVATDAAGNVYITGHTTSAKLPTTAGVWQPAAGGSLTGSTLSSGDAFVMKFDPVNNRIVYLTYLGGSANDAGLSIAVDAAGNAYVAGMTESTDFPTTAGALQTKYGGSADPNANSAAQGDAFVAKFSPDGSRLIYSTYLGGNQRDVAWAIAVDSAGSAYVAGQTSSPNFPVTSGALQSTFRGAGSIVRLAGDAFVSKLSPDGSALVYSTYLGGTADDRALGIAVDAGGNAYVTGATASTNFPVTAGAFQASFAGSSAQRVSLFGDAFLVKLNPGGTALLYGTYFGGSGDDVGSAVAVDAAGNAYVAGMTMSRNFPATKGALQTTFAGSNTSNPIPAGDAFIAKFNAAGTGLAYATLLGGSSDDAATSIAVDAAGNAAITGFTLSKDFPTTSDAMQTKYAGAGGQFFMQTGDAFVAKVNPSGSALVYASYLGGSGDDAGLGIALGAGGAMFVTGVSVSSDFPITSGALQTGYFGAEGGKGLLRGDVFLARIGDPIAALLPVTIAVTPSTASPGPGQTVQFTATVTNAADTSVIWTVQPQAGTVSKSGLYTAPAVIASPQVVTVTATSVADMTKSASAKIMLTPPPPPAAAVTVSAVVNAASRAAGVVSPGMAVVITGQGMGPAARTTDGPALSATRVLFDGVSAPLVYVSATEVGAFVPYEVAGNATTQMHVEFGGGSSRPAALAVVEASPGIFTADASGQGQTDALNGDGTANGPDNPATAGTLVTFRGTGEGITSPPSVTGQPAPDMPPSPVLPVTVTIGGQVAQVMSVGSVTGMTAGIFQVTVQVPDGAGQGPVPVVVTVGTHSSQDGVTVSVQ